MAKKTHPISPVQINVVAEGTVLDGTLYVKEDIRVSGRIVGSVTANKRVVVAPEGIIDGEIVAATVDVSGSVHGDLNVTEHLVLRSGARVDGSLKTEQFTVEKGAVFNGACRMGQVAPTPRAEQADEAQPPAPLRAESVEVPVLPDWVDALVEQNEAALEKAALPMPVGAPGIRINNPKVDENRPDPATADQRPRA